METPDQPKGPQSADYKDLNAERVFLEGLLQQRFNFFIVAFSLVIAAGTASGSKSKLLFVLIVGFLFCLLLGLCVYRVFVKVDTILQKLHGFENGVMHQVAEATNKQRWPFSFPVNRLIGYIIPIFSVVAIFLWGVLTVFGVIDVN
jgi:hypothetical protein